MLFIIAIVIYKKNNRMSTFLHIKFKNNIKQYIDKYTRILLALSSGQDSICLLQLLSDCIEEKYFNIKAVYVDHQWKNDSLNHTQHIINLIKTKNINVTIYQIKSLAFSENRARQIRYKIFTECALKEKCNLIITGHNNNDYIETFLQNIIRGTSLNGVTSLKTYRRLNRGIALLRPLSHFSRSEITWFCRRFCLPIWSDITNYNFSIKRNRLRYEMIPYLQNYFNPQIQSSLNKFINFCQDENEYIKENTLKLYLCSIHKTTISLNLAQLEKQHFILQKRVIKLFFYYNFYKLVSTPLINKLLNLHKHQIRGNLSFNDLCISYKHNSIYINTSKKKLIY